MTAGEELDHRAHRLLSEAAQVYRDDGPSGTWLRRHLERLDEPLQLAVIGPPGAGKSTLVNALMGEDLAPATVAGEARLFTRYHDGPQPRARLCPSWGEPYDVPLVRTGPGLELAAGMGDAGMGVGPEIDEAIVDWPCRVLRRTELIDTPGLMPDQDGEQLVQLAFEEADAILYLTRHLGAPDLRFLQLARGDRGAAAVGVQVMIVLSHGDETSGGRPDALLAAKQIARRRRRDPRIAPLCQDVLATSPLIAQAARTLRDEEYEVIAALADLAKTAVEPHLLSADRFTAGDFGVPITSERRARLLDRLGLGGVRLAVTLVRAGSRSRTVLAQALLRYSGLSELQASVADLFTDQRATLKARSALIGLDQLLRAEPRPQSAHLVAELERLVAGAHEFRELRLLAALRTGRVTLPAEQAVDARRLVGGYGTSAGERLGTAADAPAAEIWSQAHAAAARWRQEAQRPGQPPGQRRTAEVVLRSCTGILARLS